jgi:hypothetical protein
LAGRNKAGLPVPIAVITGEIMKQLGNKSLAGQRGSFYTTVIMLVLLGSVLTCALKIAPLFADNAVVRNSMESIAAKGDYKTMGISEIRTEMLRSLQVNNVEGFDAENIVLTREPGGVEYIDINYEARVKIVANIYALVDFTNRFDK